MQQDFSGQLLILLKVEAVVFNEFKAQSPASTHQDENVYTWRKG